MDPVAYAVFGFIAFIFSVMVHEVSHGVVAEWLGDPTAREAGRITLNPLKHIDPLGSILLPLLLVVVKSPVVLGWAKPVPYDPSRLPNPKSAAGKIAAAGPLSNFLIAVLFGLLLRVAVHQNWRQSLAELFGLIVILNISLGVFNLIPIPPLDGSKVLFALLPASRGAYNAMLFLERYGLIIIFAFLYFGASALFPIVNVIFRFLTGESLL